jgi:hypothetical protein
MDMQRMNEIILPVDEADNDARSGRDMEEMAAFGDIGGGAVALLVGGDGGGRELRAPCGLERVVQDGDEGGAVGGERGTDVERGGH